MKKVMILLLPLFFFSFSTSQAQEDETITRHPGYINFDEIEIPDDAEESVEVYVRGPLLKLVAKATREDDPALYDILSKLLLVRVNTFSIDEGLARELQPKIARIESSLENKNWEKVVRVKDRGEVANVYIKLEGEDIVGLVVMTVEGDKEAVFVNIVGEIDMEAIGKLGRKFDIPSLENWDEEKR